MRSVIPCITAVLSMAVLAGCGDGGQVNFINMSGSSSIANGGITVNDGQVVLHRDGVPEATVSATGDLHIDGKAIEVNPAQREQLKRYRLAAIAVREHGIATGMAGTALAGESVKGAVADIAGGGSESIDKKTEAATRKVTTEAMKICQDLADIKSAQDSLAGTLPAFKLYAGIIDAAAVGDCRKEDDGGSRESSSA